MFEKLKKMLRACGSLLLCSPLFSGTRVYGADHNERNYTPFKNYVPESLVNILGVMIILFGVVKAWKQRSILPLLTFGSIGAGIILIF